jgi:hypothetical protein
MNELPSHSPEVFAWLDCGDYGLVPLTRLTAKSVVAKSDQKIPACSADLVFMIDGKSTTNPVSIRGFRGRVTRIFYGSDAAPF